MTPDVTTNSESGFASRSTIRSFEVDLDPTGEDAPDTIESLLATYAACYMPALRVAAEQRDLGDLGPIEIDVHGEVDDNGKLLSTTFDIGVDPELTDTEVGTLITRAGELCKVHAALRPPLRATVTVNGQEA